MTSCLSCGAETTNGLALCELCRRKATTDLEFLPVYLRNLARWRPGRAGSRPVPGSRVLYDGGSRGSGDRVSDTLDEAGANLVGWAEALDDDRPGVVRWPLDLADLTEAEQAIRLCAIFAEHLVTISTLEWAGAFAASIGQHEATLRALTERSVPGWYAGACRHCGSPTYVVPGLTWVKCVDPVVVVGDDGKRRTVDMGCGATTYARDHLDTILDEARDWVAPPKRLAEAAVALVDTELSVPRLYTRIRQWAHQGEIEPLRRQGKEYAWSEDEQKFTMQRREVGPARYRFGDVLDRVLRRDTRESQTATGA